MGVCFTLMRYVSFADFAKTGLVGITTSVWIGLNDPGHNRLWQWSDNTPFNYSNWATGEPDNVQNIQFCVRLIADAAGSHPWDVATYWDDVQCDSAEQHLDNMRGAVCQRDP